VSALRSWLVGVVILTLCGCPGTPQPPEPAPPPAAAAPQPEPPPAPEPAPPPAQENALQREAKFVDRRVFLQQHPTATEIAKNVINAQDPLSAVAQGYFAAVSTVTIAAYQHDLKLWYELNGQRWPTFAEYQDILSKHDIHLKGLKPRQVYAYDDQTGQLSILEVPEGESID
jgi:hypothetical protein